ncbi:hypothetical protein [Nocardia sp. NPDC058705]|uniref:hypothetical protein n=1 Tax=Nocardia sp. NPDC058705 TaxID=3346609 RepID=UPI0036B82CC6
MYGLVSIYSDDFFEPYRSGIVADSVLRLGLFAVFAVLLGIGGFLLLKRKQLGKWMVVVGGEIALAVALWWAIIGDRSDDGFLAMIDMGLVAAAAAMLVAALVPATDRWIQTPPNAQLAPLNIPRPPVPPYN